MPTARPLTPGPGADLEPPAPVPPAIPGTPARPVPRWAIHRRLYDWVLSLAHHKHSTTALFVLSFAESSFFPIPPDVLQIALTLERRDRAWWYAAVSTVASVLGAVAGFAIGYLFWHAIDDLFFDYVPGFTHEHFDFVQRKFEANAFLALLTAAFTPIPFKVFTIGAGVFNVSLAAFLLGSIIGRAGRFFLVAAIMWKFGPHAKRFVDRYFNLLTLIFMALLIAGFVLINQLSHDDPAPQPAPESSDP